jgi:hypothetical protein
VKSKQGGVDPDARAAALEKIRAAKMDQAQWVVEGARHLSSYLGERMR